MINRTQPLWYARPRGTAISSLAVLDASADEADNDGVLARLGDRLFHLVDGGVAAVVGFIAVLALLCSVPAAGAAVSMPVVLIGALVPCTWTGLCATAGLLVYEGADAAPAWAHAVVEFLVIVGKVVVVMFVVATVLITLAMLIGLLTGLSQAGRD